MRVELEVIKIDVSPATARLIDDADENVLAEMRLKIDDDGAEQILDTLSALIKTRNDRAGFTREVVARIAAAC